MKQPEAPFPPEVAIDDTARQRLRDYTDLLRRWSRRINLVADPDAPDFEHRHLEDCLQLAGLLPPEGPIGDLGSGGGLPGLVIAVALPGREIHLVESDKRKAAFLLDAAARLGLARVKVHPRRIEAAKAALPPLAAVTARALAPLNALLGHAHELLAPGGIAVFPKGRGAQDELTQAARRWHMGVERFRSRTDRDATIFRISEICLA